MCLESILRMINPLHDYDNIRFHNMSSGNIRDDLRGLVKNIPYWLTLAKPIVRGGAIGSGVGYLVSKIAGVHDAVFWGAYIGIQIDCLEYLMHGFIEYANEYLF